jgi:hypothetical protein
LVPHRKALHQTAPNYRWNPHKTVSLGAQEKKQTIADSCGFGAGMVQVGCKFDSLSSGFVLSCGTSLVHPGALISMTLVREHNSAGPCIVLGTVTKETADFYFYRRSPDTPERRVAKLRRHGGSIHAKPCKRCEDHPQTEYPNGFDL